MKDSNNSLAQNAKIVMEAARARPAAEIPDQAPMSSMVNVSHADTSAYCIVSLPSTNTVSRSAREVRYVITLTGPVPKR